MRVRVTLLATVGLAAFGALVASVWPGGAQVGDTPLGAPLPGLTVEQAAAFDAGKDDFEEIETIESGLGPVFNGRSCAECHSQGATGGAGNDLVQSRVTRFGILFNNVFDPLAAFGGSLIQRRSIRELDPTCPIRGEVVPKYATVVAHRITTPLFGAGLIEAIPDSEILANADPNDLNGDGIRGRVHYVYNPETGNTEIGRFGWKAQHSSLHMFSGDAYLNELGITSPSFPEENLPQGQPIPPKWYTGPALDDDGTDVNMATTFMRFLGPPPRRTINGPVRAGEKLFNQIGCASCHVPLMTTAADHPVEALRSKTVPLYSDLLLHDMGLALADGIVQGDASGREFRTAPLWGASRRKFFLHDGRATNFYAAIAYHGGEAVKARTKFQALSAADQTLVATFLRSL